MSEDVFVDLKPLGRVGRNLAFYAGGLLAGQTVGFLVGALLARSLRPTEYATYGLLTTGISLAGALLTLGLVPAIFRFWSVEGKRVVDSALPLVAAVAGICAVLIVIFRSPLARVLGVPLLLGQDVVLAGLVLFSDVCSLIPLTRLRAEEKADRYALTVVMKAVVFGAAAWISVRTSSGLTGLLGALLVGSGVGTVSALALTKVALRRPDFHLLRRMLVFGLPLQPAIVLNWTLSYADRYIFALLVSLSALAPYIAAVGLVSGLNAAATAAFSLLWPPLMYRLAENSQGRMHIARIGTLFIVGMLLLNVSLALLARPAMLVYAPAYLRSAGYIPLLAIAYALYAFFLFATPTLHLAMATKLVFPIVLLGVGINIITNFLLIPRMGGTGAALANVCGYLGLSAAAVYISHRKYPLPYEWRKLAVASVVALICISAAAFGLPVIVDIAIIGAYFIIVLVICRTSLRVLTSLDVASASDNARE